MENFTIPELHAINNALAYALSQYNGGEPGRNEMETLCETIHTALLERLVRLRPPIRCYTASEMLEEYEKGIRNGKVRQPLLHDAGLPRDFMDRLDVNPIRRWFGTWAVTEYGVECLTSYYPIPMDRINEMDWSRHMSDKNWVVVEDFDAALRYAREAYNSPKNGAAIGDD